MKREISDLSLKMNYYLSRLKKLGGVYNKIYH